jgi:hypothetical protein
MNNIFSHTSAAKVLTCHTDISVENGPTTSSLALLDHTKPIKFAKVLMNELALNHGS